MLALQVVLVQHSTAAAGGVANLSSVSGVGDNGTMFTGGPAGWHRCGLGRARSGLGRGSISRGFPA